MYRVILHNCAIYIYIQYRYIYFEKFIIVTDVIKILTNMYNSIDTRC